MPFAFCLLPSSSLLPRLLTAAFGLPLLLALVWAGGIWLISGVILVASWGLVEFQGLVPGGGWWPLRLVTLATGAALVIEGALGLPGQAATIAGATLLLLFLLLWHPDERPLATWGGAVGSLAYVALPLSLLPQLREGAGGLMWVMLALLGTFASDTGAYVVGRSLGRHPLAPRLSAGKTREGAAAGLISSILAVVGLCLVAPAPLAWPWVPLFGATLSIAGQLGDLAESMLKRSAGVKDAGRLLPGHGGLLDRLDSLLPNIVLTYTVAQITST